MGGQYEPEPSNEPKKRTGPGAGGVAYGKKAAIAYHPTTVAYFKTTL
jgi:hypothetical protein